ncbi:MAG: neutral/alkaline non-lysosomal ceramidase N-terminal domain-containing protein [Proteobacteria bacterium]|nr:neutral/alkaline non-lysosomal ceramidase N-terminal domain-containing protein [Pseudomonadota bacterium]
MRLVALLALVGCANPLPLDMPRMKSGVTYAGVARIDLTPEITETFTDLNDNALFDGCLDQPAGGTEDCEEPFDDVNGNGVFDAVWIGGFSPLRPATEVHDAVEARAYVVAQDGEYLAFVALDFVGLGSPRIHAAKEALAADDFDPARLMVAASHNHQGPDTMGLWGNPYDFADPVTGMNEAFQQRVTAAIEQTVRDAAASMEPVTLKVGSVRMRDRSPTFSGAAFGGVNPTRKMHGMIHDIRDPVVVSDQLLVIQGRREDDSTLFTWTNWSGHPEVKGGDSGAISSDWVGVTREVIEAEYGGMAMHFPECLGGMQSALGGDVPLVRDDGTHVFQTCDAAAIADSTDAGCFEKSEGDTRTFAELPDEPVPEWAEHDSWDFVTSHGWHIGEAAIAALEGGQDFEAAPIAVSEAAFYVPIDNIAYQLLGPQGMFDLDFDDAVDDTERCPESAGGGNPCIETNTYRIELGPVGFVTAPGELLPEVAWGFPDEDPQWAIESADPTMRGPGSTYFPQHDADCNDLDFAADCSDATEVGDCNCLSVHVWPYAYAADPDMPPLLDMLDTEYKAVLGMTDNYMSYIIPEPDFNTRVSLLSDNDGDHYEDTVSPSSKFATRLQEAQAGME